MEEALEEAMDPQETGEGPGGEEMDLSVDGDQENESRAATSDGDEEPTSPGSAVVHEDEEGHLDGGEEEQMSPGPAIVQNEEGRLDGGEEESSGQASSPRHQAPAATSEA